MNSFAWWPVREIEARISNCLSIFAVVIYELWVPLLVAPVSEPPRYIDEQARRYHLSSVYQYNKVS